MMNPASMPVMNTCLRRGVFLGHIYRRPLQIVFRGKAMTAAQSQPSLQRKATLAGYTEDFADIEIMLALCVGDEAPKPNSTDEVRIYDQTCTGATATTFKDYAIISVQTDLAPACYQLTLSLRRR